MKVEDYFQEGKAGGSACMKKGGKRHEVPAHHNAEAIVDAYLTRPGSVKIAKAPLPYLDRERH